MFRKIISKAAIACAVLFNISTYAGTETFIYDGKYVEAQYDKSFSIDYTDEDGKPVLGGTLAFANVGDKQYIYIAHPLGFKDLSYGGEKGGPKKEKGICSKHTTCDEEAKAVEKNIKDNCAAYNFAEGKECKDGAKAEKNEYKKNYLIASPSSGSGSGSSSGDEYKVGWANKSHSNAEVAVHSEHFTLALGGQEMKFDLGVPGDDPSNNHITDNRIAGINVEDGNVFTADDGTKISFLSTLNYNSAQINNGDNYALLGEFYEHSPQTVSCDVDSQGNVAIGNETSSDPSCYALDTSIDKNYIDGEANNGNNDLIDWQFQFGIEIELSKRLYAGLLEEMETSVFGVDDNSAVVSLNALHASPPKANNCDDPTNGCTVTVVEKPPTDVPEPSTLAIFALALGLLRFQAKHRNT